MSPSAATASSLRAGTTYAADDRPTDPTGGVGTDGTDVTGGRTVTGNEWIRAFAEQLGVEPLSEAEVEALLDLAGVAAHGSERLAAPLTCYLVGRAGVAPTEALTTARLLAGD
jgi:hypothetical protein